ncbi:MAG: hypothetical protein KC501_40820 [Myxococcales bacterium]|nr:hypothetical protein [Myxococcales bacterium]
MEREILRINSPHEFVGGPYVVVHIEKGKERWAIVAMGWKIEGRMEPRLGIRWFWGSLGNPQSSGYSTWLVIPPMLSRPILLGLPSTVTVWNLRLVQDFLDGRKSGAQLRQAWEENVRSAE